MTRDHDATGRPSPLPPLGFVAASLFCIFLAFALSGCATVPNQSADTAGPRGRLVTASVYWQPQRVACGGGRFVPSARTTAHKTLPCGTLVRVHSPATGKAITIPVTDRGPYVRGRELDLSDGAARALGLGRSVHHVRMGVMK